MAKFTFSAQSLKHGISMVRLVKPSSGDFVVRFGAAGATFFSADKRRLALVNVAASESSEESSEEYCIPLGKLELFDADLDTVTFSVTENSMSIQASDGKQTRKATVKRRADSTRRSLIPAIKWGDLSFVDSKKFAKLLRVVGCSALVRETKTEEEMRVNQVHFYSDLERASSNARYHASVAHLPGMKIDLSIVGSDIPVIRSFCAKLDGDVGLFQDRHKLYVVDAKTNSALSMGKVAAVKPDFSPPSEEFETEVMMQKDQLLKGLDWALAALDGTQRLSCEADANEMRMSNNGEIFSMPVSFNKGSSFRADLPARFLRTVISHVDSDNVTMKFGHPSCPAMMEIVDTDLDIQAKHYVQVMRSR